MTLEASSSPPIYCNKLTFASNTIQLTLHSFQLKTISCEEVALFQKWTIRKRLEVERFSIVKLSKEVRQVEEITPKIGKGYVI